MIDHKRLIERIASFPGPEDTLRQTLDNGITVLVRQNLASPAVVINGYLLSGAQDEPADKRGLAGFLTDVMERGTQNRSFSQLYEEVEAIGASFGLNSGSHTTAFGAKGLADSLPLLLDILADVIRHPALCARQVEKARAEILTDLQERSHDTRRMARRLFYELAYPESHPYHWSQLGYPGTIAAIARDDLAAFHAATFAPEGMVVVVVGGIEPDAALNAVSAAFGDWAGSRDARSPLPPVPELDARGERRLTLDDKTQSTLVLGWPGPSRAHEDFIPCFVANTVLGVFGMYGRLGTRIREENGLAYYVYSRLSGGTGPGPWRVEGGFDPANVEEGIALILDELRRLRETLVPEDELADSLSYLIGSLPLYLETNEGVARSLVNTERHNLGLDYLQRYPTIIRSVTPEQVQRVAERWLDVERFALAVAGPAEGTSA